LDGALRCVEEMKRNGAMFERFAANQRRALADVLSRTPEDLIADPTHDDLMRAARMLREEFSGREHALEQVRALATQVEAERDQARAEIEHVSADLDCLGALSEETKALRGERDDLLVQMAAKTRETEEAQRERDLAIAAGLGIEAERAQAVAMLNEDENDPETPCRCGQISGACRSCLASALSEDHLAALADHLAPRAPALANEIRSAGESYPPSGAPDPAQESPQATETQPDPGHRETMTLRAELKPKGTPANVEAHLADAFKQVTRLKLDNIEWLEVGQLAEGDPTLVDRKHAQA
jgi:phage host-nuclease inhibitor protein Gam